MAEETRESDVSRVNSAKRYDLPANQKKSLAVPSRVANFACRNIGSNPVRFNFNSDGNNDYWELAPNEMLPFPIALNSNTVINGAAIGGDSEVECLFW